MTKLKTYADFEKEDEEYSQVSIQELKSEAIKWVKAFKAREEEVGKFLNEHPDELHLSKDYPNNKERSGYSCCEGEQFHEVTTWIIDFFNITEEELK